MLENRALFAEEGSGDSLILPIAYENIGHGIAARYGRFGL